MPVPKRVLWALLAPALVLVVAALAAPMVWLLHFSLLQSETGIPVSTSLTLANYQRLLEEPLHARVLWNTLASSSVVTVCAILLGYPLALWILRASKRQARVLTLIVLSPLLVSIVVSAYGWLVVLGDQGLLNRLLLGLGAIDQPVKWLYTRTAIVIGLTHVVLPFMVLSLLACLEKIDPRSEEAAAVLGASPLRRFVHIVLPLSLPGLISGTTLAFTIAMSAYVTPAVLGPSGPQFAATMIYNQFTALFDWGLGASMAIAMLAIGLTLVFAFLKIAYRVGGYAASGSSA